MSSSNTSNTTLVAIFASAVTAVVTGIPTDFISEMVIFPFYHESTLGNEIVTWTGSYLIPIYESIGELLGFESKLSGDPVLPTFE